jgi:hypothetical protein
MKRTHWVSRLLVLLIVILPFQVVPAAPPGSSSDSGTLVITQDGSVKFKSELDSADTALHVIPFTSTDNGTLTVGHITPTCPGGPGLQEIYGYASGLYGSYSPTGLTGGGTVTAVADNTPFGVCSYSALSILSVTISPNPGSSWLSSIKCNGVTKTGSSGSFSYSSGIALWSWSTQFGFSSKNGMNVSCSIVHN